MIERKMSPLAKKFKAQPKPEPVAAEVVPEEETSVEDELAEDSEEGEVEKPKGKLLGKAIVKPACRINILAMKAAAEKQNTESDSLCLLLVGPRQAGKSTTLGTVSGTLFLFTTSDEAHSIETAIAKAEDSYGATIVPCIIDMQTEDAAGNPLPEHEWSPLSSDQAIAKLNSTLDALLAHPNLADEIQNVGLDSVFSIFKRIDDKKNIQNIKVVQKNNFRAQEVALKELLDLNQKLVMLQKKGVNVIVTCPAAAEQDKRTGLYDMLDPMIPGYRNNLHVVGMFPDICTVGYATFESEEGEAESGYYFMFNGELTKSGKKVSGEERCVNFKPRINGILINETPDALPADLTMLAEYKKQVKEARKQRRVAEQ
jgi:hypothetical protein